MCFSWMYAFSLCECLNTTAASQVSVFSHLRSHHTVFPRVGTIAFLPAIVEYPLFYTLLTFHGVAVRESGHADTHVAHFPDGRM